MTLSPADGSKDVIIDLPPDVLAAMSVGLGDYLSIELVDGSKFDRTLFFSQYGVEYS